MIYVTDLIDDQYLSWKPGENVIITTPTGSGKTTFVLKSLLPHALAMGKHIAYICNRRILHDQFAVESRRLVEQILEITDLTAEEADCLHVFTYQYLESVRSFPDFPVEPDTSGLTREEYAKLEHNNQLPRTTIFHPEDVLYVIFDESHYFLADSRFNPATNYWTDVSFDAITAIFLTATPEPLLALLWYKDGRKRYEWGSVVNEIFDRLNERDSVRNQEQYSPYYSRRDDGGTGVELKVKRTKTQAVINEECRQVQPYQSAFSFIEAAYRCTSDLPNIRHYPLKADYRYLLPMYFNEFPDLLDLMAASAKDEKWLVFVDNENSGIDLKARLKERGCSAEYLSAQTRRVKSNPAYQEFLNIVERRTFDCQVLIATSVLDCGVSITDSRVKHVVISHSERVEFLQMLGRRRVNEGESIKLYIRYYTPKAVSSLRALCEQDVRFMVNFSRINDIDYVKVGEATEAHDGMEARSLLTAKKINGIVEQMTSGRNSSLVYNKVKAAHADWPGTGPYQNPKYAKPSAKILKEYSTSTTALLQSLCLLQEYLDALDKYQRSQNPLFYLERQLSWIGFSYNKHNWVGYEERMGELTDFLEKYATVGIPKEEQSTFAQECLELLLKLPMPIMTLYKDRSRYEQRSQKSLTLGKKRMNRVFQELEIPYEVTSKQASSGDRKTVWFVRHI